MKSSFAAILRFILSLGLIFFGLNKIIGFMPLFEMPIATANFVETLQTTAFGFYFVAALEIALALLLLFKKWVPFALIVLAPLSLSSILFHWFLGISDILIAVIIFAVNVILIYKYRRAYTALFQY